MFTAQHQTRSRKGRRSQARVVASVTLIVAILVAGACSSDDDSTSSTTTGADEASSTTAAPGTTADVASEPLVFEGTTSPQGPEDEMILFAEGFTNSVALEGDLVGQGVFVGEAFPEGEDLKLEGDWVFNLRSPDLGEGLLAVQQRDGLATPTDFNATGEVTGVSGAFADMIGTVSFTGADPGTYVFELQPAEPSPEPEEPTQPRTIEYEAASVAAWMAEPVFGGGNTSTGDFAGSIGWTGSIDSGAGTTTFINVGTLEGVGDGLFITMIPVSPAPTWTVQSEFFGVSGAFAGLQGVGTVTGTTFDATGAFAPEVAATYEVSSDEIDGISWFRRADYYELEEGDVTVDCRPEGLAHSLWGTDIYTDDSSICTAAAHAGLVTLEEGGEVTFAFIEGPDVYPASERNGVTSEEGRDWPRGFEFVDPS